MSLLSLPTEVLIKILIQLDIPTAYSCQHVNRWFHSVYQTSVELQYALECKIAGVDDNPFCHLPVSTRLEMLRARESAWSSLNPIFTKVLSLPVSFSLTESFDVVDGHLIFGTRDGGPQLKAGIQSLPLPLQEDDRNIWKSYDFDGMIAFTASIDENDLLAALIKKQVSPTFTELNVSLVSHSLGTPHPLAHQPIFPVARFEPAIDSLASRMKVAGENLVVFLWTPSDCILYVFNWKIGELKSPPIEGLEFTDLAFLSHDVMLYCPGQEHSWFDVLYIPPSSEGGEVKLIQSLRLHVPFPYTYSVTGVGVNPNPREDTSFPKYISPKRAFVDRPGEAIMLFMFHGQVVDSDPQMFALVIHRNALVDLLPPRSDWFCGNPPVLEWEQWGPNISRSFECNFNPTICYGQRFIYAEPAVEESPLVVVDFNIYRFRQRMIHQGDHNPPEPVLGAEEGLIEGQLPYISYRSSSTSGVKEMHMSDIGVICLPNELPESTSVPSYFTNLHFG